MLEEKESKFSSLSEQQKELQGQNNSQYYCQAGSNCTKVMTNMPTIKLK